VAQSKSLKAGLWSSSARISDASSACQRERESERGRKGQGGRERDRQRECLREGKRERESVGRFFHEQRLPERDFGIDNLLV
jgi:hypothetical protein